MNKLNKFVKEVDYFSKKKEIGSPNVAHVLEGDKVYYDGTPRYLAFKAVSVEEVSQKGGEKSISECRISINRSDDEKSPNINVEYSLDGGNTWDTFLVNGRGINIYGGETVMFRGKNRTFAVYDASDDETYYNSFSFTGPVTASGDVTSLLNGVGGEKCDMAPYCFYNLFENCENLLTAPELPAKTLAEKCYYCMFSGCTSLTTAPALPAKTLVRSCYSNMFYGCTSLTLAPELPATTLAYCCYSNMFYECTALTTAPALPATTLVESCYNGMFSGCTALTTAPSILPATTLASYCYAGMFENCTSLVNTPELPATTLVENCYRVMFYGCTALVTAPDLPATTLASNCYSGMFEECSNLNYIKALFTTTPGVDYTNGWVNGVSATGTFVKSVYAEWDVTGTNGVPSGWNTGIDYTGERFLTFTAEEAGSTVKLSKIGSTAPDVTLEYSTDNCETWNSYTVEDVITLTNIGDTVKFRGTNTVIANGQNYYNKFIMTGRIAASGDVTSLLNSKGGDVGLSGRSWCFIRLFYGCTSLTSAPNLPSTSLVSYSYYHMFDGCTSLVTAPELPATTLSGGCYEYMFAGCTSLTTAPELPAMSLGGYCYKDMFRNCTSLVDPPELPATTLVLESYFNMFTGCTSLRKAPVLHSTTLAKKCYDHMFSGCTSLKFAPTLPSTTLEESCYQYMFQGCTSLVTAPELPATTLAQYCYQYMFQGCTSLVTAPELPATTLAHYCYNYMFSNCTSLVNAPALPATTLANYCYRFMFSGCTSLVNTPALPATTLESNCYYGMFQNCTELTQAPELPALTLVLGCYQYMFSGCTALTTAPALPAMTLADNCYRYMFQNCSNLNYIKAMFTTTPSTAYTNNWVSGVKSSGIFVKNPEATWNVIGVNGVPNNWTIAYEFKLTAQQTNSTVKLTKQGSPADISLEYSTDGGSTWNTYTVDNTITITNIGDAVNFRGVNSTFSSSTLNYYQFQMTGRIAASGDVTSLLNGAGGDVKLTNKNYCFYRLFKDCNSLTTAPELPSTTLANYCYSSMFNSCTSLTTAPNLPSITISQYCYSYMFQSCTSLVTAPELPATTLSGGCYYSMFSGCTSITETPKLSVTTLQPWCYEYMFAGCTSLTTAPELPAETLVIGCYQSMFSGCTSLNYIKALFTTTPGNNYTYNWVKDVFPTGTFVKNSEASWSGYGNSMIPSGWTVQNYNPHPVTDSLIIYVDDFPDDLDYSPYHSYQDFLEAYVEDPEYFGANKYRYTGETFIYDGDEYYLWEMLDTENEYGFSSWNASVAYMLTETVDYDTLEENSIAYDINNRYIVGIEYLTEDMEDYTSCDDRATLVSVINGVPAEMSIYVDEFPEDDPQWYDNLGDFDTMEEYLDTYIDNLELGGANKYNITSETFSYDGDTYYVWEMDEDFGSPSTQVQYAITNTTDFDTLYGRSIESDYENYTDKFIILLSEDMGVYREDCDALLKIEQN